MYKSTGTDQIKNTDGATIWSSDYNELINSICNEKEWPQNERNLLLCLFMKRMRWAVVIVEEFYFSSTANKIVIKNSSLQFSSIHWPNYGKQCGARWNRSVTKIPSRVRASATKQLLDWMTGFIDGFFVQSLLITSITALSLIYTLSSSSLYSHWDSQSSLFVTWQRISTQEKPLRITMKSSCHFFSNHLGLPTQFDPILQFSLHFVVFPFPWFLTLYSSINATNKLPLYRRGPDYAENPVLLLLRGADHTENTSTVLLATYVLRAS
jgi:hypothetical protein